MYYVKRAALATTAVALLALGWVSGAAGSATAQRAVVGTQGAGPAKVTYQRGDTMRGKGAHVATLGELSEENGSFHGLTPCRIVDTSKTPAGALAANTSRDFFGIGKLTDQGASVDDCGLPNTATAFLLNVTAASPQGTGNLRVWPWGETMPETSLVNFRKGVNIANATAVAICRDIANGLCPEFDFSVRASNSATNVVIDVMGYYEGPMMVKVNDDGTPYATSFSVDSIGVISSGSYEVIFDRDVTSCTASAVIESQGIGMVFGGQITVAPRMDNPNGIYVATFDYAGTWTDMPFSLVVNC
ncbi:MAG: hypothetical protein ACO3C1_07635 [Ilumatobacteraceae bacterium]